VTDQPVPSGDSVPGQPTADLPPAADGPAAAPVGGPTGHPLVDTALTELDAVADEPPADQVPAFEAAHRTLTATLSAIDSN
jgi:hypothetical protein